MTAKINCWEFMRCGREKGGFLEHERGICPAFLAKRLDGVHGGMNGGRACWVVVGTFCGGPGQGAFISKNHVCTECEFYEYVLEEEGPKFLMPSAMLKCRELQRVSNG
jgi:hypothetical protein